MGNLLHTAPLEQPSSTKWETAIHREFQDLYCLQHPLGPLPCFLPSGQRPTTHHTSRCVVSNRSSTLSSVKEKKRKPSQQYHFSSFGESTSTDNKSQPRVPDVNRHLLPQIGFFDGTHNTWAHWKAALIRVSEATGCQQILEYEQYASDNPATNLLF